MLGNISIGQFFPGNSFIHRLDPRVKIVLTIALLVDVFISRGFIGFGIVLLFVLAAAKSTKISLMYVIRGVKPILFIAVFTFILNLFMQSSGDIIFQWKRITITTGGLRTALFMAIRLLLLVISSQLLTLTTSSTSLTDGIESLMKPTKKIGVPVHEIAMMMSIALRFIPTLMEEADKIMNAQKARGADFETGNIFKRAKALVPLLVPLFISAFRRADELALAMEARCYRGGDKRTRLRVMHMGKNDLIAILSVALLTAVIIALNSIGAF